MLIRCSQLGKIMTSPKSKAEPLSVGAKTYIRELLKQDLLDYQESITSKYFEKGNLCEQDSINLMNDVLFTDYRKNTERRSNDWLNGECDIFTGDTIIDIKTPWSISTFPVFAEDAENPLYEWQLRGYMMLWGVDKAALCYCLVDTPEHLIGWEDPDLHHVSHIPADRRITRLFYTRDAEKEAAIVEKVTAANEYYNRLMDEYAARIGL